MINVVMPQMGESLAEGTIVRWLKAPGARVARDEPLVEISTDKVDTDVPAPASGVLKDILVAEGQTVAVGTTVAIIEETAAERVADGATTSPAADSTSGRSVQSPAPEPAGHFRVEHGAQVVSFKRDAPHASPDATVRFVSGPETSPAAELRAGSAARPSYSPAVLDAIRRKGVSFAELTRLTGSGRHGRITKQDVERYVTARDAGHVEAIEFPRSSAGDPPPDYLYRPHPEDRIVPMSPVRRKIAHHMSWSTRISPHATAFADCDMWGAARLLAAHREQFAARTGAPLTYTVLSAHAVVAALREFPVLNSSVVGDALAIKPHVHLGVAVALQDTEELIVPVVKLADELTLDGLARAIADLAIRARERRLRPEDVQDGTFTLTNPGIFGGLAGTPILNQPQVGILGLGAITPRPVVIDDAIAIRPTMTMSLTFDHRAADGMVAFRFLDRVRRLLEESRPIT